MASVSDYPGLQDQSVLVTGGHGFIGRHVMTALSRAGARPVSLAHPSSKVPPDLPGDSLPIDLEDEDGVAEVVKAFDILVHLAARTGGIQFQQESDEEVFTSNRRITDNLLSACVASGVRRIFLASSLVTYRPASEPLTESHPQLGPADRPGQYAWSKITDEVVAPWHGSLDFVVGRFGNVYGPGASFEPNRSTVVHALIDRASRLGDGEELVVWGEGDAIRSFVYADDAAEGILLAITRGTSGEAYNIDSGAAVSIAELASVVRDQVNPSLVLRFDEEKPSGESYRVGSVDKLGALGYDPRVGLQEGIGRTVAWYRDSN